MLVKRAAIGQSGQAVDQRFIASAQHFFAQHVDFALTAFQAALQACHGLPHFTCALQDFCNGFWRLRRKMGITAIKQLFRK